ncbi:PREDICTED: uncharacterized protein LOC109166766 [Ipomoea nil]|uniref:uncharacterized protein LOC109166766 n=1 Tax=Ipomoea nil TaxID=35883 RepID=UPI000900A688|nr:PREDICTED: uncharacterized protein LOC109166766 [Ipomoea nil]
MLIVLLFLLTLDPQYLISPLLKIVRLKNPHKESVVPLSEQSESPHPYESVDGVPVYTSSSLAESLEHIRHFADSDDEKILAEVYGSKAPSSYPNESLVAEIAHPDSTTFKIREVTKLLTSSTVHGSETSNSVSPSPTKSSPVKESRKSKRKGVSENVVVDTSKAPPVVPSTKNRKIKAVTKPRRRSVTPGVQNAPIEVPESPDTSVYKLQFVSDAAQDKWSTMVKRELIVQRSVDENQLNSVCDVLPLLHEVGLLKTVTSVCGYSKLLTYEFYCNLNEEINDLTSKRCMQIFIRGTWYVFGPDAINQYYGLKTVDEDEITSTGI